VRSPPRPSLVALPTDALDRVFECLGPASDPRAVVRIMATSQWVRRAVARSGTLARPNTDVVDYPQGLRVLLTYARAEASLTWLRLRANRDEGPAILTWFLGECDASQLSELHVSNQDLSEGLRQMEALRVASCPSLDEGAKGDATLEKLRAALVDAPPRSIHWVDGFRSLGRYGRLRHLEFAHRLPDSQTYVDLFAPVAPLLETLELVLRETDIYDRVRSVTERETNRLVEKRFADVNDAIAQLERLRVLRLRSFGNEDCHYCCFHPVPFHLASATVEYVDVRDTRKGFSFKSVDAPRLRELHVMDHFYGNGLRRLRMPLDPNQPPVYVSIECAGAQSSTIGIPAAGNTWVPISSSNLGMTRVSLPDQCLVVFHKW